MGESDGNKSIYTFVDFGSVPNVENKKKKTRRERERESKDCSWMDVIK